MLGGLSASLHVIFFRTYILVFYRFELHNIDVWMLNGLIYLNSVMLAFTRLIHTRSLLPIFLQREAWSPGRKQGFKSHRIKAI